MTKLFITGFVLLCSLFAFGQTEEGIDILNGFDTRFAVLDSLIFHADNDSAACRHSLLKGELQPAVTADRNALDSAINARTDAEIGVITAQTGLKFTGQTYYRLDNSLGIDEDDNGVSRYKSKVQAELRWYPFQSAVFKRKGRIREQELRGMIDRLAFDKEELGMLVERQKEVFRNASDTLLAGVLLHRINNLNMLSDAYLYLLGNQNISSDDLLQILNEKAEAERLLATLPAGLPAAVDLSSPSGFTISVDTTAFLKKVRSTQADLSTLKLQMELLETRASNTSYWTEVNAAPFVRYSLYTRPSGNSSNVDAGLVFTIPVSKEFSRKKAALRAQRDELAAQESYLSTRLIEAVKAILVDIDRYNRAAIGEYRRMDELKRYLEIRRTGYDNRVGEYNRLARMKEYNSYLLCCEKFISFQYSRDCAIADLQKFLTDTSILEFCRELPLESTITNEAPKTAVQ